MSVGDFLRRGRKALRRAEPVEPVAISRDELPRWAGGTGLYSQVGHVLAGLEQEPWTGITVTPAEGSEPLPQRRNGGAR